ncbi:MAG: flagellar basal body-associated FliL family protein [Thermoplasmatales archaeon]
MSEPKTESKDEGQVKKKSSKLPLILVVIVVLAAGVGGFMFFKSKGEEPMIDESLFYKQALLDTYIVNLMSNKNFLKTTIYIEYNPFALERWVAEKSKAGGGHGGGKADPFALPDALQGQKIALTDAVIRVLSSKRAEELLTPEGKERLRDQLVSALNEALGAVEPIIVAVKFGEFIIQ